MMRTRIVRTNDLYKIIAALLLEAIALAGLVFVMPHMVQEYINREVARQVAPLKQEIEDLKWNRSVQVVNETKLFYTMYANIRYDTLEVTAYAPSRGGINCSGDCNTVALGFKVSAIKNTEATYCAVDPNYIPLGSVIVLQGYDKPCVAVDTGGAIKGNKVDLMIDNHSEALKWGRRKVRAIIIIPPHIKGGESNASN